MYAVACASKSAFHSSAVFAVHVSGQGLGPFGEAVTCDGKSAGVPGIEGCV